MDDQNKNLIFATVLSFAVILVWFLLFPPPEAPTTPQGTGTEQIDTSEGGLTIPSAGGTSGTPLLTTDTELTREQALLETDRVSINTESLEGSISLLGGRIDDLSFKKYHETVEAGSPM